MASGSSSKISVLIVDDHPVVRHGVRALIEQTWSKAEVIELTTRDAGADDTGSNKLDVIVIDPWRAGEDPADTVARLTGADAPVVVFTSDGGARLLSEALKAGVKGYVRKDSPSGDLVRAIEAARAGDFYIDPSLSSTIVLEEGDRTLSARQRQILQMLGNGMKTEEVANELGLSTETVRTHAKRILAKLEASTRTQAVAIGLRHGLIE